jgi:Pyruvate/2-oxoacid:ferredoxin oxidoreductase gamma subunit
MVGAFAASSGLIELSDLKKALKTFFKPELAEKNFESARMAFNRMKGNSS